MKNARLVSLKLFCTLAFVFAAVVPARAQITDVDNSTSVPIPGVGHDYIKMLNETVDPVNGSVSLRIAVPTPPGRRLTLPFSFNYDTQGVYSADPTSATLFLKTGNDYLSLNGWSYSIPRLSIQENSYTVPHEKEACLYWTNLMFLDATGVRRGLGLTTRLQTTFCRTTEILTSGDLRFRASNTSGSGVASGVLASDADGTTYSWVGSLAHPEGLDCGNPCYTEYLATGVEDRNGNQITIKDLSSGAFAVTDTLGRSLVSSSGFGKSGNTVTVSGLAQPYQVTWAAVNYSYPVSWTLLEGPTGSGCGETEGVSSAGSSSAITAITLPNSKQYTFTYDPTYGLLSKMTYPTGGWIEYTWSLNTQSATAWLANQQGVTDKCLWRFDKPALLHRYVSYDGTNVALQQDFSYSTTWGTGTFGEYWNSKQTTVTTHDLVRGTSYQTSYVYVPGGSAEPFYPGPAPFPDSQLPVEQTITYQDTTGKTLRTVTKAWDNTEELASEQDTLDTGLTSQITYTYGSGGQVTEKEEYDFGQSSPTRETVTNYQAFPATPILPSTASIFDRPCQTIVYDSTGTNRIAETDYLYDGGTTVCGSAGTPSVSSVSGLPTGTHDETNYPPTSSAPRANLTTVTKLCLQSAPACASGNPAITYTYDETGQALSMLDPNLNTTQYSYADSYTSGTPPGSTNAYLTKITRPAANGIGHISNYSYGYADGQLTVAKDENGQSTTYAYSDPLDRLTLVTYPTAGGETTYTYNDVAPTPSVTTQKELSSGNFLTTVNIMDGMGHPVETEVTSDPAGTDQTATTYDGLGRTMSVTNPYRTTGDPTYGVTTYAYDSLGRVTTVTNPDSSTVLTAYTGRAIEVTDEGNGTKTVQRISQTDALERLTSVCEVSSTTLSFGTSNAPAACGQDVSATGFLTSYQYDPLGNLLSVSQGGLNARSFVYDSLSRLTSSTNPESGAISYSYDANGNLISKIAPKPNQTSSSVTVTTTNQYDALNRITSKSYNDGATPTAGFAYDACPTGGCPSGYPSTPNSVGRLVESSVSNGATFESYDAMGRTVGEWQCTPQNCGSSYFPLAYAYDLLGDVLSSSNGASVTLSYTYNAIAQLTQLTSSLNNSSHLATLFSTPTYNAPGQLTADKLGNGISETRAYNSRLRLTSVADGTAYNVALTYAPNGNVITATDSVNGTWSYGTNSGGLNGYDDFNRLLLATSGSSTYSYLYDRYGNRWEQLLNSSCTAGTASCLTFDANNHENNGVLSYDAAGNVLSDNMHHYSYDAENRLINVDSGTTASYIYDANGRRVRKTTGSTSVDYLYDVAGHQITELSSTGGWNRGEVYAGGRHLATYTGGTSGAMYFIHADWLGTERARTTIAGAVYETCSSLPFGDGLTCTGADPSPMHLTGKQRDSESGLDNFGARYDSSNFGRFMSVDWTAIPDVVPYANFADPQTLNLYIYVRNNPLSRADADGHSIIDLRAAYQKLQKFLDDHPRTVQAVTGAAKVALGVVEVGVAATTEVETGGTATALGAAAVGVKGGADVVSGTISILGAIKGTDVNKATQAVETVSDPVGLAVTIGSQGNLDKGEQAATVTGLVTGAVDLTKLGNMTKLEQALAVLNAAQAAEAAARDIQDKQKQTPKCPGGLIPCNSPSPSPTAPTN